MGGNALKNCETGRLYACEYDNLQSEVFDKLVSVFPTSRFSPILAYSSKESFGDMDILCTDMPQVDYNNVLEKTFNSKEVVHNGNVWSFEYKKFQIDLIFTNSNDFYTSYVYYAYNDLGNFMGRIAHKLGFKYGHDGLTFQFRSHDDHIFAKYVVSNKPQDIFKFLDFSYERFMKGFSTLEEIFEFASSSKFFNKQIFHLDNRNATSRVRDKKRANYSAFTSWMETKTYLPQYQWLSMSEKGGTKENKVGMSRAFEMFPGFREWYNETELKLKRHNYAKSVFNAKLAIEVTGYEGEKLGKFMKRLKELASLEMSFDDYVNDVLKDKEGSREFMKRVNDEFIKEFA